jgi:hypothetical protein
MAGDEEEFFAAIAFQNPECVVFPFLLVGLGSRSRKRVAEAAGEGEWLGSLHNRRRVRQKFFA